MRDFAEQLRDSIDRHHLLTAGQSIVVAVSGGADSVALLAGLCELSSKGLDLHVVVAHLDHGLRAESADDAAFVWDLGHRLGVQCLIERVDVAQRARDTAVGAEEAGRQSRYEFFISAAARAGATAVAIGHTADDNVETVLFNLLRGSHLRGLRGIPSRRRLGPGLELIRPMLEIRRSLCRQYLGARGLSWREDPSNAQTGYTRNFIRHELLPLLRQRINPGVDEAIARLAKTAEEADEFLTGQAESVLGRAVVSTEPGICVLNCAELATAAPMVRRAALILSLQTLEAPLQSVSSERLGELEQVALGQAVTVNLPGGLEARYRRGHLTIQAVLTRHDESARSAAGDAK